VASVEVEDGTTVFAAARAAGIALVSPCGGKGRCGRCVVEIREGAPEPTDVERQVLGPARLAQGRRMACRALALRDLVVVLPAASRAEFTEVLADGESIGFDLTPAVVARVVGVDAPALDDPRDDLARLVDALGYGRIEAEPVALRELPRVLRANGFCARAILRDGRLLRVEPPSASGRLLGAAFDVGTTTVAGALLDLENGRQLAVASRTNPQHALGDDVVSRMDYASGGEAALGDMQSRIVGCVGDMLAELARTAGVAPGAVHEIVVAGNNVMTHLFLGLPPEAMATVPFAPVTNSAVSVPAAELGLAAAPTARVTTVPSASAYVGGDIIAGLTALGFSGFDDEVLFIDIGTNGEVVAGSGARAMCAATAAGPAFEGARISCGMRAVPGAIAHARLADGNLDLEVLGGGPPGGVCGTGLVDLAAAMLETGVLDDTGRIVEGGASPLASRVREGSEGIEFVVASGDCGEVALTQRDIRELQLAKGAIAAGAGVLLGRIGVAPADVRRVLLAGAFGSTIRPESAVAIGLLPDGIDPARVCAVGNTAAAGARAFLASRRAREEATRLARWLEVVELSADLDFQDAFADAMMFRS